MLRQFTHKMLIAAMFILLGGWAAVAQNYVELGSEHRFSVVKNSNFNYHWSKFNQDKGTTTPLISRTNITEMITFDEVGVYIIKVKPQDKVTGCYGAETLIEVIVPGSDATAGILKTGDFPVCSQYGGEDYEMGFAHFRVKYSGPKPWNFGYSLDGNPVQIPTGADEITADYFDFKLSVLNNSIYSQKHNIEIFAKGPGGISVKDDPENHQETFTVLPLLQSQLSTYDPVIRKGQEITYVLRISNGSQCLVSVPVGATLISNDIVATYPEDHKMDCAVKIKWGDVPGDYRLILTEFSGMGCNSDPQYVDVKMVDGFTASLGDPLQFCLGESRVLTPTIDLDGDYEYLWSDGSNKSSLEVSSTGEYSVEITDKVYGDKQTASVEVTTWSLPSVDLGEDYQLADGEVKTLDAQNAGAFFSWSTGETVQKIQVNTSGNYSVTVTNKNGCSASDDIRITSEGDLFVIDLGEDQDICAGEVKMLDPNPSITQNYTYKWSTGATTSTLSVDETGIYSVTVTDEKGNQKTDEMQVTVHARPIVDFGDESIVLYDGETATLDAGDAGDGSTYEWSTGDNTQTIEVDQENVYSVKVTTKYGCSNADDVKVIRREGHKFTVYLGGDKAVCKGEKLYLEPTVDRNFSKEPTYRWIPTGSTDKGILVDKAGKFCVEVTDPYGNMEGDCMTLTLNPTPEVDLGEDRTMITGQPVELNAENQGSNYTWSTGDVTQKITVTGPAEYWVEVVNKYNCTDRDTVTISIDEDPEQMVDVPTGFSPNGDGLNDVLYVRGKNISSMDFIVVNRLGQRVFQSNRLEIGWDGTYQGARQDMDAYIYILKVSFLNGKKVYKRGSVTLLY